MNKLLSEALLNNKLIDFLGFSWFKEGIEQAVFKAMKRLRARGNDVDLLTLRDELNAMRKLEEVGGESYLSSLVDR